MELYDENDVNEAILATTSRPYFKIRWLNLVSPSQSTVDQTVKDKVTNLMFSATKILCETDQTAAEEATCDSLSDPDDYFGFSSQDNTNTRASGQSVELSVFSFPDNKEKSVVTLNNHPMCFLNIILFLRLQQWNAYFR